MLLFDYHEPTYSQLESLLTKRHNGSPSAQTCITHCVLGRDADGRARPLCPLQQLRVQFGRRPGRRPKTCIEKHMGFPVVTKGRRKVQERAAKIKNWTQFSWTTPV